MKAPHFSLPWWSSMFLLSPDDISPLFVAATAKGPKEGFLYSSEVYVVEGCYEYMEDVLNACTRILEVRGQFCLVLQTPGFFKVCMPFSLEIDALPFHKSEPAYLGKRAHWGDTQIA
jgi:hypothetical protein